ncbi:hypothetical protein OK351_11030 [Glutamicibacter sp. MNS18]|uniref:hypothetical protein n=1 Tax=Glutamicibacter sp. MNS18 TaxID=2989817 RepID=UPI0022369D47|nr:hypothetical protein [Glutamicibacter sp. MNS18]MCW4466035.1 hypothetical protein [Glutamicibacter sp. MNS18]
MRKESGNDNGAEKVVPRSEESRSSFFLLAVAAINMPRVPQLVDYTMVGWVVGETLLLAALVLAFTNHRTQPRASISE